MEAVRSSEGDRLESPNKNKSVPCHILYCLGKATEAAAIVLKSTVPTTTEDVLMQGYFHLFLIGHSHT